MIAQSELKDEVLGFLKERGADLIGFAPVNRWDELNEVHPDFRPGRLFPQGKTVIVFGMGMPLPVVETTPSAMHMELYNTVNRVLDDLAYQLSRHLCRKGIASYSFPRDGYGNIRIIKDKPRAAFSHVYAAKYAGLGTIGMNNVILTSEYGPRIRWVSVFADAVIEGDPIMEKELCIRCRACAQCCPVNAILPRDDRYKPDFNSLACAQRAEDLTRRRCYPCGICIKVCPVGNDRKLFNGEKKTGLYLAEKDNLETYAHSPESQVWNHYRQWGSWSEEEIRKHEKN